MHKHEPKARKLCPNCFNDRHDKHNKDINTIGIKIKANHFGNCECPICNYCDCDWCKDMRKLYGIGIN